MFKRLFKKSEKCKTCYSRLSAENIRYGFCPECAKKEVQKLKRRMIVSSIVGTALIVIVFIAIRQARTTAFVPESNRYDGSMFIPTFFGHLAFNARVFDSITNLSLQNSILLGIFCFIIPFGSYVRLEFNSYREKAEIDLYRLEPLSGGQSAGSTGPRLDGVGLFVITIILSILSGPFFFVYRLFKLRQLSRMPVASQVKSETAL